MNFNMVYRTFQFAQKRYAVLLNWYSFFFIVHLSSLIIISIRMLGFKLKLLSFGIIVISLLLVHEFLLIILLFDKERPVSVK